MQNIILFIPCYNCQNQISRVLAHLKENDNYKYFSEILIIDNRSTDNTVGKSLEVVDLLNLTNVKVYTNSHNVGLGGTHKMAFTYAQNINATHVAVLHGDDQGNINDLIKIIRSNKHNEHDCCLGSRFSTDSQLKGYSKFRIFGNYIFNIIYSLCSLKLVKDLGAGVNIYKVDAVKDKCIREFSNDLTFNCFLLLYSISRKQDILYFPIEWTEDDQISNVKLISQAKRTLRIALIYLVKGIPGLISEGNNKYDFDKIELQIQFKKGSSND